jgi:hypothetical protein
MNTTDQLYLVETWGEPDVSRYIHRDFAIGWLHFLRVVTYNYNESKPRQPQISWLQELESRTLKGRTILVQLSSEEASRLEAQVTAR